MLCQITQRLESAFFLQAPSKSSKQGDKYDDSGPWARRNRSIENFAGIEDDSDVSGTPTPNQIYHVETSFFLVPWTDIDLNFKLEELTRSRLEIISLLQECFKPIYPLLVEAVEPVLLS